ncbi:MAG: tRNA (adenosine(37)-N6)-threonylcarbamoyltransferase complex ATPase subunit type 1 TsaE [Patescibacteria group bacterium]
MKIITKSEKETFEIAKNFTATLKGGEALCLIGELGSGKTVFAKGIAKGLGIKKIITSPTFVLMKVYPVKYPAQRRGAPKALFNGVNQFIHIDAYRLNRGKDLEAIGAKDYLNNKNCVTVIEWADRVKDILPKKRIMIEFKVLGYDKREILIKKIIK